MSDQALMHNLTKGAWEGVIYGSFAEPPYNLDNPEVAKYKAAMAKYYPETRWGIFPYAGFLYARPFSEAIQKLGKNVTREGLIDAMENLNTDILGVNISYSPEKRQALRSMQLLKCTGAESFERISDYIESNSDIVALAKELEGM